MNYDPTISPEEARTRATAADAEAEKALAKVLTPEQLARVRQIALRARHDPAMGRASDPLVVYLAGELGPTPAQCRQFDALRAAHAKAVARATLIDDFTAAYKGARAAEAELETGLAGALTADQRARLKLLVGEPIAVNGWSFAFTKTVVQRREELFGRYTDELRLLKANTSIQTELKLTRDQIDLAAKSSRELY